MHLHFIIGFHFLDCGLAVKGLEGSTCKTVNNFEIMERKGKLLPRL